MFGSTWSRIECDSLKILSAFISHFSRLLQKFISQSMRDGKNNSVPKGLTMTVWRGMKFCIATLKIYVNPSTMSGYLGRCAPNRPRFQRKRHGCTENWCIVPHEAFTPGRGGGGRRACARRCTHTSIGRISVGDLARVKHVGVGEPCVFTK